jgi:hypothetical protein
VLAIGPKVRWFKPSQGGGFFIHSQALIVQDGPLASLLGFLDHTHTHTHTHTNGTTSLDE